MKRRPVLATILWLIYTGVFLLMLMTLLRIVFTKVFPPSGTFADYPLEKTLFLGLRYDARDVAIVSCLVFLLSLITALNPFKTKVGKKIAMTIWTLFAIVAVLFYIVDFANYAYLQERLNADLLNLMKDTKESVGMMWQTYPVVRLLLAWIIGVIVIVSVILFLYKKVNNKKEKTTSKAVNIATPILFFLLLALLIFGRVGQYPLRWSDAFSFGNDYAAKVSLNPFQSFFSSMKFRKVSYDIAEVKNAYPTIAQYLGIENPDVSHLNYERKIVGDSSGNKPNIVVVICESFSFYKSSMSGNKLDPTPYFNRMCQQGILFERCFTPSYGTARGVWATLTGIPDIDATSTSSRNPKAVNQHLIMNDFKGYDKYYFIGGSLSWANIRGFLTNNIVGLKTYEQDDYDAPKIDIWGVSDKHVFLKANEVFAKENKPFVSIVQTSDNHRPYTIPEEDRAMFQLKTATPQALHDNGFASNEEYNAFRYTDFCYQQFIEAAKKEAYFKNTIFLFVGDHGIRGDASKMFPTAWTEELSSEHVPLLVYAPGLVQPQKYSFPVSQVDIFPTAAGLSKISYTNTTLGRDLLSPEMLNNTPRYGAFIYDYVNQLTGVVKDSVYYSHIANSNSYQPKYQSTLDNNAPILTDEQKACYKNLTEYIYSTAQYMLLNNKVK
ncbi:MAG: sulfatase-like hydrolase/transferase [Chitinophagaceae bacterium]